jgi:hypothetical protein
LIPADNAGLGLARATAVVRVLMLDERLKGYTLLPLSGGQLIGVDDRLTKGGGGDERERRRIEIRVRRANSTEGSTRTLTPPAITPATPPQNRAASPPATPPQNRAASPPATPPPPRRSSPPDRVVAPSGFPSVPLLLRPPLRDERGYPPDFRAPVLGRPIVTMPEWIEREAAMAAFAKSLGGGNQAAPAATPAVP